jgi:hypothetical protein
MSEHHMLLHDSGCLSPAVEQEPSLTIVDNATPVKPQVCHPRVVTALDLRVIVDEDNREPDHQAERAVRTFRQTGRLPKSSDTTEVIRHLVRERVNAILQGDYDKAKDCDAMAKSVAISQSKRAEEERRKVRIQAAEDKLQQARRDYEEVHQESLQKLREAQRELKKRMADLDATHGEQMQAFEKKWNS